MHLFIILCVIASFDDALRHIGRMRSKMPAMYNPNRVREQPIPRIVACGDEQNVENSTDDTDELANIDCNESNHMPNDTIETEEEDVKPPVLEEIRVTADDANAFDSIFGDETTQTDDEIVVPIQNSKDATHDDGLTSDIDQFESGDEPVDSNGQPLQRFKYSDDVLCFFESNEDFRPILENE